MEIHMDATVILGMLTLGIILLLVGLVGKVKAKEIEVGTNNKFVRAIIGIFGLGLTILALLGIFYPVFFPVVPTPSVPSTVTPAPTYTLAPTQEIITTAPILTSTPGMSIFNFQACLNQCNGLNSVDTFPEKTKIIYLQWQYQNIPAHATYKRTTTLGSRVWATFTTNWDDCVYPNSSSPQPGMEAHTFTEPNGIASGVWTITVEINGEVLLQKNLTVLGNWNYFDPAGLFTSCSGKH
jgi:hypothetical protein